MAVFDGIAQLAVLATYLSPVLFVYFLLMIADLQL